MGRPRRRILRFLAVRTWKTPIVRRLVPLSAARRIDRRLFDYRRRRPIDAAVPSGPLNASISAGTHGSEGHTRLLVSVNPNLKREDGHFLAIDRALASSATGRDLMFATIAHRSSPHGLGGDRFPVIPCFSNGFDERHLGDPRVAQSLSAFPDEFARGLAEARGVLDLPLTTFWYQANLEYVALDGPFVDTTVDHHLHLFFAHGYDLDDHRQVDHIKGLLGRAAELANVNLSLGTKALADLWGARLGVDLPVLPSAPSLLPTAAFRPARRESLVLCPGTSSRGKGYEDTLELVRLVVDGAPEASDWELVVRDESYRLGAKERRLLSRAGTHAQIRLLDGPVDAAELAHLYATAGAVVLPYRPDPFALRSSGSFTDAVASGAPLVAVEGTIAGHEVSTYRFGNTYEAGSLDGLVQAIIGAATNPDCEVAATRRKELVEENSVGALLTALVGPDRTTQGSNLGEPSGGEMTRRETAT